MEENYSTGKYVVMSNMESSNYSVVQIVPYFGKWPEYFDLYLYSCSRNPMIKFIFYTDCPIPEKIYDNTVFHSISYKDYCEFVSQKLHIKFAPPHAYKLADLKPFIAIIHSNDINHYTHWAFGDLDLCFGDMRMIINETNLAKYDLITTHDYHIAGHFTVMRNNDYFCNLCFDIPNWEKLLECSENIAVDEIHWSNVVLPSLKYPLFIYNKILKHIYSKCFHRLMRIWNKLSNSRVLFKEYHTSPEPELGETWVYDIASGKIFDSLNREVPYLHFLFFKNHPNPVRPKWNNSYYKLNKPLFYYSKILISTGSITGL